MEIVLKRKAGRYRKGQAVKVSPTIASILVKAGRADYAKPAKVEEKPKRDVKKFDNDLTGFLKAELVSMAVAEGVELDSTETKADLIAKIEKRRTYLRRDMQAE